MKKVITLIVTTILLLAVLVVPVAASVLSDIGFEIDGNTASNGAADWETIILGGEPLWHAGTGTLIRDGNSGPKSPLPDQNIFAQGGKFGDPAGWTILPGNTPAQNDLTNIYVAAYPGSTSVSHDSWIVMGMHRLKSQGTFDLDFEFNQVAWNGTSGTLVRTPGDIVVGFELSGNPTDPQTDLQVVILYYLPTDTNCSTKPFFTGTVYGAGFCEVFRGPASALSTLGEGTMNGVAFNPPPWGAFNTDGSFLKPGQQVAAFDFAEAAIDLSKFGINFTCPGFGSVHAKSRSSLSVTADMKDLAGPVPFGVSCHIDGYKFHDLNADGTWQKGADGQPNTGDAGEEPTLTGWTINLLKNNVVVATTTTDASGHYIFDGLSDGLYTVQEVCPAGWFQSYPGPNPAASCGGNTYTFNVNTNTPTYTGDFGNYQNGTVSGMKFKDMNSNGVMDTGEPGLNGWTIKAFKDVDGNGALSAGDTAAGSAATAGGGLYSFSLTPGKYIVCEVAQANWTQTAPANTVCQTADPIGAGLAAGGYAVTLTSAQVVNTDNFGNTPLSNFNVNFYDLTGSTNATITCTSGGSSVGSSSTTQGASPETTLTANGVKIGTYTCTITITDP